MIRQILELPAPSVSYSYHQQPEAGQNWFIANGEGFRGRAIHVALTAYDDFIPFPPGGLDHFISDLIERAGFVIPVFGIRP